jgi:hypothetical protein
MTLYVFLVQRKQDSVRWPLVYKNRELAEQCIGRCSPVVEVEIPEVEKEDDSKTQST